jgi:phosphoribosylamine-glycine ligase
MYGLKAASKEGVLIFQANQKGRVLSVVGRGETIEKARAMAYRAVEKISFGSKKCPKQIYRPDIAQGIEM